jgi:hypothetical protein
MAAQTTPRTRPQSRRKRMVRKQVYILPKQEEALKRLAEQRGASEAELIREAIEIMLQAQPVQENVKPLPPNQEAWQALLRSMQEHRMPDLPDKPHRWTRADYYDDERSRRLYGTLE